MTHPIIKFIVRSNLWVAICFAFYVYQTCLLLDVNDFNLVFFSFFSTLFTYNAQRIYKFRKSNVKSPFNEWVGNHMPLLLLFSIIGIIGIAYTSVHLKSSDYIILTLPVVFSFYYVVNLPLIKRKINLRELPLTKIFAIALSWTILVVFLPLNRYHLKISNLELILLILEKFFFVLAITIPFDIRDAEYDSPHIKTIPQVLGYKVAYRLSYFFLFVSFLFLFFQVFDGIGGLLIGNVFIYLLTAYLIFKSRKAKNEDFHGFFLDGVFLLQTLMVIAGNLLFDVFY